jgi:hypothetical protein
MMRGMRTSAWMGVVVIALAGCGGGHEGGGATGSGTGTGTGASAASAARPVPPPPRPPTVTLVRCAPAPSLPIAAGILGVLTPQQGGAFASLTGTGDISSGFDDSNIMGGLLGSDVGDTQGLGGLGLRGSGADASDHTGWGTLGTDRYGTIGHGSGVGSGYGVGGGRHPHAGSPSATDGQAQVTGDLDKAVIRRYVHRHLAHITYCYEKALLARPALAGTLRAEFVIGPDGLVASSSATGVDPEVATCVAGVIKDIEFPAPRAGGLVRVTYPFTFRSGDPAPPAQPRTGGAPPRAGGATPPPYAPAWTPYASITSDADEQAAGVATLATQAAVTTRLAAIDACFGAAPGGSVRAILQIGGGGIIDRVRAGGLGDDAAERCIERELGALHVGVPPHHAVEVACDLTRGPEAPWRLTLARYDVYEVGADVIRHDGVATPITQPPRRRGDNRDVAIVADATATGAGLRAVAPLAQGQHATLYAVRGDAGAPTYVGVSDSTLAGIPAGAPADWSLHVRFVRDRLDVCLRAEDTSRTAPLASAAELDRLFAGVTAACAKAHCGDGALVGLRDLPDAGALLATITRLRALGVTRVVLGDFSPSCR